MKNYLTSRGAGSLRAELEQLLTVERPRLMALPENDPAKGGLLSVESRIASIQETLASAVVVEPPPPPHEQVRFGATVTVRHGRGEVVRYRIVGVDETDIDRDWISWLSPLAKSLLNARVRDELPIRLPAGDDQLTILGIEYE